MRISIICTYYPFPPSVGGVETIVRNVAVELAKRGHEVHIVTSNLDVTTQKPVTELGLEERDGIIVHKLKPSKFKIGYACVLEGLKETLTQIKPDIVHAHNLHPHLFQLAKWKEGFGYRLIAELHYPAIELDFLIQKLLFPLAIITLKHMSKNVDAFIAHTRIEKEWLINSGIEAQKVYVIRLPGIPSKLLEFSPPSNPSYDVIYVGRIVQRKGLHILMKALHIVERKVPNVKTTIIGPADNNYLKHLTKLISRLRLRHLVKFRGVVDEIQKYELIRQHKVLVVPSIKDYTPIVIMEAQALGTPVVATKVGAIPEMIINNETGLLAEPGNVEQLAKAIETILTDEGLRIKMSTKAREWARNFVLENQVDKLEALYEQLLRA